MTPLLKLAVIGSAIGASAVVGIVATAEDAPPAVTTDALDDLVALHRSTIRDHLGRDLFEDPAVSVGAQSSATRTATGCTIVIAEGSPDVSVDVAHQLFRCFQYDLVDEEPEPWLGAGQAHFFDDLIAGEAVAASHHHRSFICDPTSPLVDRVESAVTVHAVADSLGLDPWGTADAQLLAGGGLASIAASGAEADLVLERLSTMIALDGGFGPEWTYDAIGRPDSSCLVEEYFDGTGTLEIAESVGAFGVARPRAVTLDGELVRLQIRAAAGAFAFDGQAHQAIRGSAQTVVCVAPEPCLCPDGSEAAPHVGQTTVAVAGGSLEGGPVRFTFERVEPEDVCVTGPTMVLEVDGMTLHLRGGYCTIDEAGFLQGAFGYVPSWDARTQDGPYPNAGVGVLSEATPGTRDGASLFIALDGGATRQVSPSMDLDADLQSAVFEGAGVAGSFECGEFQDPSAPSVGN